MKKSKILMPAIGMLLLSTAASVTGTVAWFSANQNVSTGKMTVQARAENGIVIRNETTGTDEQWKEKVDASHPTATGLLPTSTKDASAWYHNVASDLNSHVGVSDYATLSTVVDTETGIGYVNSNNTDGYQATATAQLAQDDAYYLLNKFFIKSSSSELTNQSLMVNQVIAECANPATGNLDKSLRVLVKAGTDVKIFAPVEEGATEYNVYKSGTIAGKDVAYDRVTAVASGVKNTVLRSAATIPANSTTAPLEIDVYIYFEGEDPECKSANLAATLDSLAVSVTFGIANIA